MLIEYLSYSFVASIHLHTNTSRHIALVARCTSEYLMKKGLYLREGEGVIKAGYRNVHIVKSIVTRIEKGKGGRREPRSGESR